MREDEEYEWLTPQQVAKRRGVTRQNVSDAIRRGKLKAEIVYETETEWRYRIRSDWLDQWAENSAAYRNRGRRKIEQIGRRGAETVAA